MLTVFDDCKVYSREKNWPTEMAILKVLHKRT